MSSTRPTRYAGRRWSDVETAFRRFVTLSAARDGRFFVFLPPDIVEIYAVRKNDWTLVKLRDTASLIRELVRLHTYSEDASSFVLRLNYPSIRDIVNTLSKFAREETGVECSYIILVARGVEEGTRFSIAFNLDEEAYKGGIWIGWCRFALRRSPDYTSSEHAVIFIGKVKTDEKNYYKLSFREGQHIRYVQCPIRRAFIKTVNINRDTAVDACRSICGIEPSDNRLPCTHIEVTDELTYGLRTYNIVIPEARIRDEQVTCIVSRNSIELRYYERAADIEIVCASFKANLARLYEEIEVPYAQPARLRTRISRTNLLKIELDQTLLEDAICKCLEAYIDFRAAIAARWLIIRGLQRVGDHFVRYRKLCDRLIRIFSDPTVTIRKLALTLTSIGYSVREIAKSFISRYGASLSGIYPRIEGFYEEVQKVLEPPTALTKFKKEDDFRHFVRTVAIHSLAHAMYMGIVSEHKASLDDILLLPPDIMEKKVIFKFAENASGGIGIITRELVENTERNVIKCAYRYITERAVPLYIELVGKIARLRSNYGNVKQLILNECNKDSNVENFLNKLEKFSQILRDLFRDYSKQYGVDLTLIWIWPIRLSIRGGCDDIRYDPYEYCKIQDRLKRKLARSLEYLLSTLFDIAWDATPEDLVLREHCTCSDAAQQLTLSVHVAKHLLDELKRKL